MTDKERELRAKCVQAWGYMREGISKADSCKDSYITEKEYDANIAAALKERDKRIRQCRYYSGQADYPYADDSTLNYYWDIERGYASLLGDILDDGDYDAYVKKDWPGIPRGILLYMFFRWGKGVIGIADNIQGFYDQVEQYLEIPSDHYPKDRIPG